MGNKYEVEEEMEEDGNGMGMRWVTASAGRQKLQNVTVFGGINKITHAYFSLLTGRDRRWSRKGKEAGGGYKV